MQDAGGEDLADLQRRRERGGVAEGRRVLVQRPQRGVPGHHQGDKLVPLWVSMLTQVIAVLPINMVMLSRSDATA